MQEFEFVVAYEAGADRVMDVFGEYPSLSARSSACYTDDSSMWRIDHASGSREAMEQFDATFLDETRCNECLNAPDCDTTREYHVLDRQPRGRTVYTYREEVHKCHSIPHFVVDHVGDGAVLQSRRTDVEYRWKVLFPDEQPVGELFDTIESELMDGLTLELAHLTQSGNWSAETRTAHKLSPEQHEILEAAVAAGYYDRPRAATVKELAETLGIARSTAQYRLRAAEDAIVTEFVRDAL
jgi:predicted DNA binding protein